MASIVLPRSGNSARGRLKKSRPVRGVRTQVVFSVMETLGSLSAGAQTQGAFLIGPLRTSEGLEGAGRDPPARGQISQLTCPESPLIGASQGWEVALGQGVPAGMNVLDSPQTQLLQNLVMYSLLHCRGSPCLWSHPGVVSGCTALLRHPDTGRQTGEAYAGG